MAPASGFLTALEKSGGTGFRPGRQSAVISSAEFARVLFERFCPELVPKVSRSALTM